MRSNIGRLAARFGAVAVVAAAGLAVTAMPASAAPGVDLGLTMMGSVVASGSDTKTIVAKVTNLGDTKAEGLELTIDATNIDTSKVKVGVSEALDPFCDDGPVKFVCQVGNVVIRNDSVEFLIPVTPVAGASGSAGSVKVTVSNDQDTNAGNNSATTNVSVSQSGVDIVAWADDVVADRDADTLEAKRIAPGGTAEVYFGIANDGSESTDGLELVLQLPEHVSFVSILEGCSLSGDKRRMSCNSPHGVLNPGEYIEEKLPVKVAADSPQSVELKGSIEGRALGVYEGSQEASAQRNAAVAGWAKNARNGFNPTEVDNTDNTDDFVVFVGASTGGGGGGLPVTGPKALVIGGVGAAVLVAGVVMFIGARRRRIVLVTPAE